MSKSIAIGATITIIIVIVVIIGALWMMANNNIRQNEYCTNWSERIDEEKVRLENNIWSSEAEYVVLNQEINDYNKQCAY